MTTHTILHFTGYARDTGGILSAIRGVAPHNACRNILVVATGFRQSRQPLLPLFRLPGGADWDPENLYSLRTWLHCLRLTFTFRRLLLRHPHILFHGHTRAGMIIALLLDLLGHRRVLVSIHANARLRLPVRVAHYRLKDRLFFLCPSMKRHYGLPDTGWQQCLPSVSPDQEACPAETLTFPNSEAGRPLVFAGIGTLIPRKGWHLVIEALALLPVDQRKRLRFEHSGDTLPDPAARAYAEGLQARCRELHLDSCVTWHGFTQDITALIRRADGVLIPSNNEPFSLVMLEALFAGRPVLASASGGPSDLIRHGENGWLFPNGDAHALAALLESILDGKSMLDPPDQGWLQAFRPESVGPRWAAAYTSAWAFARRRRQ